MKPNPLLPPGLLPDTEHLGVALAHIALTLAVAWLVQRAGFLLVGRAERWLIEAAHGSEQARQRARTLGQMSRHLVTTLVGLVVMVRVLETLGWDVKPLLVGASILGAALGFGAQFLVRDIIAGVFILAEDQFSVGDRIEVNGRVATVEAVTLRATRLRDFDGRLLFVPNGEMKIVVNHSRGWGLAVVDLPLDPNQDLEPALAVTNRVVAQLNADPVVHAQLIEPLAAVGFERLGAGEGAVLRVAGRAQPGAGVAGVARETRRRALAGLRAAGIHTTGPEVAMAAERTAPAGAPAADH